MGRPVDGPGRWASYTTSGKKKVIVVENNYTGQFNRLLKTEFLIKTSLVHKFDGEAFYPGQLAEEIQEEIKRGD